MTISKLLASRFPRRFAAPIDLAPLEGIEGSQWLLLFEDGQLLRFDAQTGDQAVVGRSNLAVETSEHSWGGHQPTRRLYASSRGEFAAVVTDYGRRGQLLDLRSGQVAAALDGGDYHPETVPFSFAFVEVRGRTLAVHRSDWNRLELTDLATGKLVSQRDPASWKQGEQRPEHYLDYFHGALHVSPDGARILDDGWVWHPMGVPVCWNVHRWVLENVWESEDGPTRIDLGARDNWDEPMVWLDSARVATRGLGDEAPAMASGVRVFDVTQRGTPGPNWREDWKIALEVARFDGPAGQLFGDGDALFSVDEVGLTQWRVPGGERVEHLAGFRPSHQHRARGELAQVADGSLLRWPYR